MQWKKLLINVFVFSAFVSLAGCPSFAADAAPMELIKSLEMICNDTSHPEPFRDQVRAMLNQLKAQYNIDQPSSIANSRENEKPKRTPYAPGLSFRCEVKGKREKEVYRLTVNNCAADSTSEVTAQALNGKVFSGVSIEIRGGEQELKQKLGNELQRYVSHHKLNPSGSQEAEFTIQVLSIESNGKNDGQVSGFITGDVKNFAGEQLPITASDKIALTAFYNMRGYMDAKVAMLSDAAQYIRHHERLLQQYEKDGQLLSLLINADREWVIALGAGHGARVFYELLKAYYDQTGPGGKVIFRTTNARSKWVNSHFESEWNHKIQTNDANLNIEYYAVPGSYLYVMRRVLPGTHPDDVANYAVVTRSPEVWRESFSMNDTRSPDIVSSFGIAKEYAADIVEVVRLANNPNVKMKLDWTKV